jgi:hypothetical protein
MTLGPADDAFADLAASAPGWGFVASIDDMQARWEDLNRLVRGRLDEASRNFRVSADGYEETETATTLAFRGPASGGRQAW